MIRTFNDPLNWISSFNRNYLHVFLEYIYTGGFLFFYNIYFDPNVLSLEIWHFFTIFEFLDILTNRLQAIFNSENIERSHEQIKHFHQKYIYPRLISNKTIPCSRCCSIFPIKKKDIIKAEMIEILYIWTFPLLLWCVKFSGSYLVNNV